ncbi:hypothetical protein TNCV_397831 [Trichonephila clavipes]|nr:hypothetical protein TNCV_397831 [Trichonephila clavipes]
MSTNKGIFNSGVRNRCLHLATGRTRDDIKSRIWQGQRRKGRNGGEESGGEGNGGPDLDRALSDFTSRKCSCLIENRFKKKFNGDGPCVPSPVAGPKNDLFIDSFTTQQHDGSHHFELRSSDEDENGEITTHSPSFCIKLRLETASTLGLESHNRQGSAHRETRDEACLANESDALEMYERMVLRNKGSAMNKKYRCWMSRLAPLRSPRTRENPRRAGETEGDFSDERRNHERQRRLRTGNNVLERDGHVPFGQRIDLP